MTTSKLKAYESEVKGTSSSTTNSGNVAFLSAGSTNSATRAVNTAHGVNTASTQGAADSSTTVKNLSDAMRSKQSRVINDLSSFNKLHNWYQSHEALDLGSYKVMFCIESIKKEDATISMEMFPFGHCLEGNGDISSVCFVREYNKGKNKDGGDELDNVKTDGGGSGNSGGKRLDISMVEEAWLSEKKKIDVRVDADLRQMDFRSFIMEGIDGEFHFELGKSKDASFEKDVVILLGRTVADKAKDRKAPPQASKATGDPSNPLYEDSDLDIHEFPSAKELKDSTDCHWVVAHMTPPSWKQHLKEISLEKLCNIYDNAYMWQVVLDNVMNRKTRELMSTLTKARASCDAIREREKEKDKSYAELEINRLVLEEKKWVNYEETLTIFHSKVEGLDTESIKIEKYETQLLQEIDGFRQDRAAAVEKLCSTLKEVASLKDPFELEKMLGYHPLLKKEFDQAGDNLATTSYPFLAKVTSDPYAPLEVLLLKKPKSLHAKPAPSKSKPSSSKAQNPTG
ncbi:hypothetical protein Tco_1549501 [Tanacetum coccineum]